MGNPDMSAQVLKQAPIDHRKAEGLFRYDYVLTAVIVQAAGDFVDAYMSGLINEDCTPNLEAIRAMIEKNRTKRNRFPRWMEASDIQSAATFLFDGQLLESVIPADWSIDAPTIRKYVLAHAKDGRRIDNFFNYEKKTK